MVAAMNLASHVSFSRSAATERVHVMSAYSVLVTRYRQRRQLTTECNEGKNILNGARTMGMLGLNNCASELLQV